jgi:hypothetical protein
MRWREASVEGRKSYAERDLKMVALARKLRGSGPRPAMSFREIADELFQQGYGAKEKNVVVKPFTAMSTRRMIQA